MSLYRYRATASVRAVESGMTYWRPRRNAWMFFSTATPFTRIASSMASGGGEDLRHGDHAGTADPGKPDAERVGCHDRVRSRELVRGDRPGRLRAASR
jgi:hypothetical protein